MSEVVNENRPIAVKLQGVKKRYTLGQIGGGTLQADLQSWWARVRGKEDPNAKIGQEERIAGRTFMALNGIDLTIYQGERIGIIGGNGAGKSTMLKLLSRVTAPTTGKIDIYGRIASMLEVGTGFNPEMTGRENVYMNGAILGMTKEEIDAKMEDIIEFSEVRDFIDTPVKRYSSGMYVKLAFSVAAHLDSEIMIMDEVLAVGDMAFQNKCLAKMREVASKEGKTILYVSHNMNTVRSLCDRCIVLEQGKIVYQGNVDDAIKVYGKRNESRLQSVYNVLPDNSKQKLLTKRSYLERIELSDTNIKMGDILRFNIHIHGNSSIECCLLRCVLHSSWGEILGIIPSTEFSISEGENEILCSFSTKELSPGGYLIDFILVEKNDQDYYTRDKVEGMVTFVIDESYCYYNMGWQKQWWGNVIFNSIKTEKKNCIDR